jgi:hypothetical protein
MTFEPDRLPEGADRHAYDAMLDREFGIIDKPIELSIEPMRYRMITVGPRIPLPEGARILND